MAAALLPPEPPLAHGEPGAASRGASGAVRGAPRDPQGEEGAREPLLDPRPAPAACAPPSAPLLGGLPCPASAPASPRPQPAAGRSPSPAPAAGSSLSLESTSGHSPSPVPTSGSSLSLESTSGRSPSPAPTAGSSPVPASGPSLAPTSDCSPSPERAAGISSSLAPTSGSSLSLESTSGHSPSPVPTAGPSPMVLLEPPGLEWTSQSLWGKGPGGGAGAQAAAGSGEEECPICTEPYDSGRHTQALLNCGHVLCSGCLHAIMDTAGAAEIGRVRCPMCRQKTPMLEWEICKLQEELLLLHAQPAPAPPPALAMPPALPPRGPGLLGALEHHFQVRFHTSRMFGCLPCVRYPLCLLRGLGGLRRRCHCCYLLSLALLLAAETLSLLLIFLPIGLLVLLFLILNK